MTFLCKSTASMRFILVRDEVLCCFIMVLREQIWYNPLSDRASRTSKFSSCVLRFSFLMYYTARDIAYGKQLPECMVDSVISTVRTFRLKEAQVSNLYVFRF